MRAFKTFSAVLLSTTAALTLSAKADASLAELQARLEKAQKENLLLKTEKVERENLTMKAEALEQENTKLRAEAGKGSTSLVAQSAPVVVTPVKAKPAHVASTTPDAGEASARRSVNRALDTMPKDDPRRDMTARAVPVSSVEPPVNAQKSWSGIYGGINAGYGGNAIDTSSSTNSLPAAGAGFSIIGNGISSIGVGGPLAGGQVGYNYQFANNVVLGVETDMDYADINNFNGSRRNSNAINYNFNNFNQTVWTTNYDRLGLNWLGTTRARVGYAIGNFLPYISAGVAYGELTSTLSGATAFNFGGGVSATSVAGNNSAVQAGWAAGAGMEYMVANAWSLKGEYLYTSLAGIARTDLTTSAGAFTNVAQSTTGGYNIHQARVGLNYHTDWLASKPAVVAKY